MSLREVLQSLAQNNPEVLLSDGTKDWDANSLLENLSDNLLRRNAHMQPGLYIAAINEAGYLGQVLYRVKQK